MNSRQRAEGWSAPPSVETKAEEEAASAEPRAWEEETTAAWEGANRPRAGEDSAFSRRPKDRRPRLHFQRVRIASRENTRTARASIAATPSATPNTAKSVNRTSKKTAPNTVETPTPMTGMTKNPTSP
jgi:hypothetical protein